MVWQSPCWAAPLWGNREARVRSSRASLPIRPRRPAIRLRRGGHPVPWVGGGHNGGCQRRDAASAHRSGAAIGPSRSLCGLGIRGPARHGPRRRDTQYPGSDPQRRLAASRPPGPGRDRRAAGQRPGGPGPPGTDSLCTQRRQPRTGRSGDRQVHGGQTAWTAPRKRIARPTPGCSWSNPRPCCNGASWSRPTSWPLWPASSG